MDQAFQLLSSDGYSQTMYWLGMTALFLSIGVTVVALRVIVLSQWLSAKRSEQ